MHGERVRDLESPANSSTRLAVDLKERFSRAMLELLATGDGKSSSLFLAVTFPRNRVAELVLSI